jgi:DUF2075 family protein
MLVTVDDFRRRVRRGLKDLVRDLQESTGRFGDAEAEAWSKSLTLVEQVLRRTKLDGVQVQFGAAKAVDVEYRLPSAASWADLVLLGRSGSTSRALMVELKDWEIAGDRPGPRAGLIQHKGSLELHPSEQVRGYVEYCRRFHSAVHDAKAEVDGCAFMTNGADVSAYLAAPHDELTRGFPVFGNSATDLTERFPRFLDEYFTDPDDGFADRFEKGRYLQDRNFIRQVAEALRDPKQERFVLLDHQRKGFELAMAAVERVLSRGTGKAVILVEGPPGSGKSVLAANLWAALARDPRFANNIVFTTTSGSQKSNWKHIFEELAGGAGGRGIVIPANQYNPGLTPNWVQRMREDGRPMTVAEWKDNLALFVSEGHTTRMDDDAHAVTIIDEAHALIDPTGEANRGIPPSGWSMHAGPQAWHILRASRMSIFLMDTAQSYRDNETTTAAAIEGWAREQGVTDLQRVSLAESQFRCSGSKEYLDWIENLLGIRTSSNLSNRWRKHINGGTFGFEIASDPLDLEDRLRSHLGSGESARLVASYSRPWKSKKISHPSKVSATEWDFEIPVQRNGRTQTWKRIWNFAPDQDYRLWVQAPPGSSMAADPLSEVGCPYVVRGFDYDYLGLLWMSDLVWRRDHWEFDPKFVCDTAWKKSLAAARGPHATEAGRRALLDRLLRSYRILLSRAMKGVYVWFEDAETGAFVKSRLMP